MKHLLERLAGPISGTPRSPLRFDLGGAAVAFLAAALLGSWVEEFTAFEWSLWAVQAILALSLTLVWGYGGVFSLGQAAVYGVGGYAYGFWAINFADNTGETVTAVLAAVAVATLFAALLGYFMFYGNLTDVYVAIVTLATSLVLFAFMNSTSGSQYKIGDAPFGGYNGMTRIPRITWRLPGGAGHELTRVQFFMVCVACGLLIAVGIRALRRRPFGRIAVAMQQNELRTELLGYDVRRHKLAVFALGGSIAGFAGALYAAWGRFISPTVFSLTPAILVVIWILAGSRSRVSGAFVGVLVVEGLSSWFGGDNGDNEPIVLGALLVFIVLALPGGVVTNTGRALNWARRRWELPAPVGPDGHGIEAKPPGEPAPPADTSQGSPHRSSSLDSDPSGIRVEGITKRFGGLVAVKDVTLAFPTHGVSCLIGPNGAGKSTLFGLLSGQLAATGGSVLMGDTDLTRWRPHRRTRIGLGIKLQVASVYRDLPVLENLWLACNAVSGHVQAADRDARELLEWLGLDDMATRPAGTLSHGQRQWLEIGMVMAGRPRVVLLDEPTAGMTREETARTADLVLELGRQASVVVVEHNMEFVRQLDAPVTVLHMGSYFTQGSFEELSRDQRLIDIYLGRQTHAAVE